ALVRAIALQRIDRTGWAAMEWKDALSRLDDSQRRMAIEVAQEGGWFDRGVFGLDVAGNPEEKRWYQIRFPIHHESTIRAESARHRLDPAWVAAEIRAESIFNPRARPSANARGRRHTQRHRLRRRRKPVPLGHQHRHRHRLPAADGGQVRPDLSRHRRLQRRPLAGGALAVAAPGDGPGLLDRDDQLQGNPRLRGPRARLQRDLRLAHERRRATGEPAPARRGRRRAQEVRLPGTRSAKRLRRFPSPGGEQERSGIIGAWTSTSSAAQCATGCWASSPATTTTSWSA